VIAGLTGWGLASSRSSNGQRVLKREELKKLDLENRARRFLRWRDGQFENRTKGCLSGSHDGELPLTNFAEFNFIGKKGPFAE